jgi:hypothetical protein
MYLVSLLRLLHHTTCLLPSRLAFSIAHTIASRHQTAILIDLMTTSPAIRMRLHQPTMRMRITAVAWNKSSGSLVFQLRILLRILIQIVSDVAVSARFAKQSDKVAS